MLQAWLSIGFIVLLAILLLAFVLWRRDNHVLAVTALVVGVPLWFAWEYARPTWTTGVITEPKCAAAIPMSAATRPTSNPSTCATGPIGGSS